MRLLISYVIPFLIVTSIASTALSQECDSCPNPNKKGSFLYIGPEIYRADRSREGGTKQKGWLYGVRVGYEHMRRYTVYLGADALYARGPLWGKSGSDSKIKSIMTDRNFEARVGYTFQCKSGYRFGFTPFIGYGYFIEENQFCKPSPLIVSFHNKFSYVPLGFIVQATPRECLSIAVRFKARFLLKHLVRVTDKDPEIGSFKMHYEERLQYRVDVPIIWRTSLYEQPVYVCVDPFYEYRDYGRLANFPFDFLETTIRIYGGNISLIYQF